MRTSVVCCFVAIVLAFPAAAAPDTTKPGPIDDSAKIAEKLLERIDIDKSIDNTPLHEVLDYLHSRTNLNFLLDTKALMAGADGANQEAIYNKSITLPALKKVRVETVLKLVADQIDADYHIATDHVLLTTTAMKDLLTGQPKRLPELYPSSAADEPEVERALLVRTTPCVTASFKETAAAEAFKEIASRAGRTVVIAQSAADKGKSPISVNLSNVAFETAAASLAEAAGLRAFRTGNVVVIVSAERAKQVEEQHARFNSGVFGGPMFGFVDPASTEAKIKELEEKVKKLTEELEKKK